MGAVMPMLIVITQDATDYFFVHEYDRKIKRIVIRKPIDYLFHGQALQRTPKRPSAAARASLVPDVLLRVDRAL